MEDKIKEKINSLMTKVDENAFNECNLRYGLFYNKMNNYYNELVTKLKNEFNGMCDFYSIDKTSEKEKLDNILEKLDTNFDIIFNEYDARFKVMVNRFTKVISNENIAIVNYVKSIDMKENLLNSSEYIDFSKKIDLLRTKLDNAETALEYEKYYNEINNSQNPLENINLTIDKVIRKYEDYLACEEVIINFFKDSMYQALESIKCVEISINENLVKQENPIVKIFAKLLNKINGKKKFEKYCMDKIGILESNKSLLENKSKEILEESGKIILNIEKYINVTKQRYEKEVA